jgi:sulfatase modifying factor 1
VNVQLQWIREKSAGGSLPYYWLGRTEVTQSQWHNVMGTTPWKGKNFVKNGHDFPATYVSWEVAQQFCEKLSQREGKSYRLPTEAQWEWSCRAGMVTPWAIPNLEDRMEHGWFFANAWKAEEYYPHQVALKRPNPLGLYDMHGNVWEWCHDWYGKDYPKDNTIDPMGQSVGKERVLRGGCWSDDAKELRSANRFKLTPDYRSDFTGFRVSMTE